MTRILYVYARGGAPLEHAFPRIAALGELHVLALTPLPTAAAEQWRDSCASVTVLPETPHGDALVQAVVAHADTFGADAVLTLSEFAVLAVARAADKLGLRGAGPNVVLARDKRLMREAWAAAGVPVPGFRRVDGRADLRAAVADLHLPVLLKPAWGAGSIGQAVLRSDADVDPVWSAIDAALDRGGEIGMTELYEPGADRTLLVEEIVRGSTEGWYDRPGYADYVSVEGIVADGVHHALGVTARLPPIPPFNEVGSTAPCVVPVDLQRRVEDVARRAVDALGLRTCGTHTELKLCADGRIVVIETAARFGGVLITREIEEVFGLDPIELLVRELLGHRVDYPPAMLVDGCRAAASLVLTPADAAGNPWRSRPIWAPDAVDWAAMLSPGSTIEPVRSAATPPGRPVPAFDPAGGAANWLGVYLITAVDPDTLLRDCNAVLDGLESALPTD
ncbi:ATP-grasp domain-containing protein [Solihabitans fulvus]|uniref:ATP-grasp domain-containing protein n=1 Tax=Solihabitans fulvus TaxID=1892852 RepID=A0A5B2W6B6_9PSEU|nr:ATP-grasp domain-containing protein [Solihabitans fulvus]KAA2246754.1 ATP-grasp domain-containing protein [Solihabitans fulvus]